MKVSMVMQRIMMALAVCFTIGISGVTLAKSMVNSQVKVTKVSEQDIIEKLEGKDTRATVLEVTFEPGKKDTAHRHAGPVFGYVLEGEYEHAINNEPVKKFKTGESFYEPSGCLHQIARNPSGKSRTRLLAVILHPRDVKAVTVWEQDKK